MASTLYLRQSQTVASGLLTAYPTGRLGIWDQWLGASGNNALTLSPNVGSGQVAKTISTWSQVAGLASGILGFNQFVSDPLTAQTVSGANWTVAFAADLSNATATLSWQGWAALFLASGATGTNRKTLFPLQAIGSAGRTATGEFTCFSSTISGASGVAAFGDYLVFEYGLQAINTSVIGATPSTDGFSDGTTVISSDNAGIGSAQSRLVAPGASLLMGFSPSIGGMLRTGGSAYNAWLLPVQGGSLRLGGGYSSAVLRPRLIAPILSGTLRLLPSSVGLVVSIAYTGSGSLRTFQAIPIPTLSLSTAANGRLSLGNSLPVVGFAVSATCQVRPLLLGSTGGGQWVRYFTASGSLVLGGGVSGQTGIAFMPTIQAGRATLGGSSVSLPSYLFVVPASAVKIGSSAVSYALYRPAVTSGTVMVIGRDSSIAYYPTYSLLAGGGLKTSQISAASPRVTYDGSGLLRTGNSSSFKVNRIVSMSGSIRLTNSAPWTVPWFADGPTWRASVDTEGDSTWNEER